jgi:hypothetical protein
MERISYYIRERIASRPFEELVTRGHSADFLKWTCMKVLIHRSRIVVIGLLIIRPWLKIVTELSVVLLQGSQCL